MTICLSPIHCLGPIHSAGVVYGATGVVPAVLGRFNGSGLSWSKDGAKAGWKSGLSGGGFLLGLVALLTNGKAGANLWRSAVRITATQQPHEYLFEFFEYGSHEKIMVARPWSGRCASYSFTLLRFQNSHPGVKTVGGISFSAEPCRRVGKVIQLPKHETCFSSEQGSTYASIARHRLYLPRLSLMSSVVERKHPAAMSCTRRLQFSFCSRKVFKPFSTLSKGEKEGVSFISGSVF